MTAVGAALAITTSAQAQAVAENASGPPPAGWPSIVRPAAGAPSILLIMTDDVGFGASSTFGGPVPTPTFDALASEGLRYTQMTTTGICSPTRAALLTGRNHNRLNMGNVTDSASRGEGFTSNIPESAATGARLLQDAGYATAMFGKSHLTPSWETGPSGPFDRWPTGLGFGHFYGFLGGDTNQWAPALYSDNTPVEPPTDDPGYILDRDLADKAVQWVNRSGGANPGKPMFVYYAPGTAHAPHHAPADWIAKFRGKFDNGWDAVREETLTRQKRMGIVPPGTQLAARPDIIPAWSSLSDKQKRVYAREMEVYAAALAYADYQIGRVVDAMRADAKGNLLVVYVQGDNGASPEGAIDGTTNEHALFHGYFDNPDDVGARLGELGSSTALNHYSAGWAIAMDAPFPWFKQLPSHMGAIRNGVVISWPGQIKDKGSLRPQFHHITDIMPTLLEAAHVSVPQQVDGVTQQPMDGVSMRYSFDAKNAPSHRKTQYYAIWDNLGIYSDGWFAGTEPAVMPWIWTTRDSLVAHLKDRKWQLYNLTTDFSQSKDLAKAHPEKLAEMQALFNAEAERNQALPIRRYEYRDGRPDYNAGISDFQFHGPAERIPEDVAPRLFGRSFSMTADVGVTSGRTDGVLMAVGGRFGGMSWYLKEGRPTFHYNLMERQRTTIAADAPLKDGDHRLGLEFRQSAPKGAAKVSLTVDGKAVATGDVPETVNKRFTLDESFDVGSDRGTPVAPEHYATPNRFDGVLTNLEVKLD